MATPLIVSSTGTQSEAAVAYAQLMAWRRSLSTLNPMPPDVGVKALAQLYKTANLSSLCALLPCLLSLESKPFTLKDHFPFEPLFSINDVPIRQTVIAGRQLGKSTALAAMSTAVSAAISYLKTIHVTPLFEQIRKFSANYVKPFLENSPIRSMIVGQGESDGNVLQRTLRNGSTIFFTYATTDADRARGVPGNRLVIDEGQDMDFTLIPILEECLSASTSHFTQVLLAGTAKTTDNTLSFEYEKSSQGRWVIKCDCGYWNTCSIEADLDKMVQEHGLACAKCRRLIRANTGHWKHMSPGRYEHHRGIHIPQPIMPMHYSDPRKWRQIWLKKTTKPKHIYLNECLGEPCDTGTKLVSKTDLKRISKLPWKNNYKEALRQVSKYQHIQIGVDWGGGAGGILIRRRGSIIVQGGSNSYTVATIVGFNHDSVGHVLYTERLPTDLREHQESARVIKLYKDFRCSLFAHDAGGAGKVRESILINSGMPIKSIIPFMYTGVTTKNICTFVPPNDHSVRYYYSLDKARSVGLLCSVLKAEGIFLPEWQEFDEPMMSVFEDFLSLIEDKHESDNAGDIYRILYNPKMPNDFVHALNFACTAQWYSAQQYPNLAEIYGIRYNSGNSEDDQWSK